MKELTSLDHLRMTAERSKELSAQVAMAALEAIEELTARIADLEQRVSAMESAPSSNAKISRTITLTREDGPILSSKIA